MICRLVFNLTCNCFQSKLFVVRTKIRMTGLSRAAWQAVWQAVWWCLPQQMWISKGEYELLFKVLIRHFLCSWQSAKTPGGGSFGHPRQEECLCLTIHIATALHFFSACTLDVTSTVMTRMQVRSSMCAHSPLSGLSVNESCAQYTEQKHGKLFFLFSFFFFPFYLFSSVVCRSVTETRQDSG